jgi:hypothetical protein
LPLADHVRVWAPGCHSNFVGDPRLAGGHVPAKSRIFDPASGNKSLLVLFFRKEQESSFSEEKEAKRLLFLELGVPRSGTWPENGLVINSLAEAGWG